MRTGSVSEASRELHISQPAVSKILKHAESRLGIELFKCREYPLHLVFCITAITHYRAR